MKILIATPLYPPDIKEPAPYVKELAKRLSPAHEVTVLAYNHIPERVPGVTIITIEKSTNVFMRLVRFFLKLRRLMASFDVLFIQNGPSVELPVLLALLTKRQKPKIFLRLGDHVPLLKGPRSFVSQITRMLMKQTKSTFSHDDTCTLCDGETLVISRPLPRPETLPFMPTDEDSLNTYRTSWSEHVARLETLFTS